MWLTCDCSHACTYPLVLIVHTLTYTPHTHTHTHLTPSHMHMHLIHTPRTHIHMHRPVSRTTVDTVKQLYWFLNSTVLRVSNRDSHGLEQLVLTYAQSVSTLVATLKNRELTKVLAFDSLLRVLRLVQPPPMEDCRNILYVHRWKITCLYQPLRYVIVFTHPFHLSAAAQHSVQFVYLHLNTSFVSGHFRSHPCSIALLRSMCQYAQASSHCTDETFTAEKLVEVLPFLQQNLNSPSSSVRLCEDSFCL